ncbi:glycosyltransferase family 4 protein [Patescibacteria group bacterium]|nr:glycosyltransferase family 4 protein [Patescibacteria group bacterium]MBU1673777.1 glycosyltransferase family 4 protein [Patescibacteria group bacterium]MBU1964117.1 glycosyltransferase family 4 protein [Patescibacteria group bacterium]
MRIGIDCRTILSPNLGEKAGVGHYTYYLVKNLIAIDKSNEYVLFFDHRAPDTKEFEKKNVKIIKFPFSQYKKYMPYGYSHLIISAVINREKIDLFHGPANTVSMNVKAPCVITIHDLAIYNHPSWFPSKQGFSTKYVVPKSVEKADKIIAVSESTKNNIIKLFKTDTEKIDVIYEGFEKVPRQARDKIEKIKKKFDTGDNFVFYVGTIEPRKNLDNLVKAFDRLMMTKYKKYQDFKLIIAGGKGWKFDDFFSAVKKSKCGRVRYIDYVTHDEKIALMSSATAFVFPSLWEGFGLPVLEAMNLDTPVITSDVSSLPEVAGDAALLVNPKSVKSMEKGLDQVLGSLTKRETMIKKGGEQAKKFSWNKAARETLKTYKKIKI